MKVQENEEQAIGWVKIFVNDTSVKGLLPKIKKRTLKTQQWKNEQSDLKMGKDLKRHLTKEGLQMANKHIEMMLNIIYQQGIELKQQLNAIAHLLE